MAKDDRRTSTISNAVNFHDHGPIFNYIFPRLPAAFEALSVASVFPSFLLVTFQAMYNSGAQWQWGLIYLFDFLYLVFIVSRFFPSAHGAEKTERKRIIFTYLKRGFVPDVLSILPIEVCAFGAADIVYVAAFLRLNRCLRCYRGWTYLSAKEKQLGTNTMLLMSLRFVFLSSLSVHVIAGVWYSLACYNKVMATLSTGVCKSDSWARHPDIDWLTASDLDKYIVTLYWAVTTITSVGYGDIIPSTSVEKWVATICMLWGVILFGYILGSLASMLTNADAQRSRYVHRLNAIRDHLSESGVSDELKRKVVGYYEYLWQKNKGKGVTELFEELPLAFQAELSLETYRAMIEMSSLFDKATEEFMRMLSLVVKHTLYLPGQVIINKGDIGHHMYFIRKGEVEVVEELFSPPLTRFRDGEIFGEVNLVYSVPCGATIRAKTHCDILLLSKTDTHQVLQHFPEMGTHMKEEIKRRCDVAFNPSTPSRTVTEAAPSTQLLIDPPTPEGRGRGSVSHGRMSHDKGQIAPTPTDSQCGSSRLGRVWSRCAVIPGSTFALVWDLVVVVVTIAICWLYSYQAGFSQFKSSSVGYCSGVVGWIGLAVSYCLDVVLVADVVLSLKRAIRTPTEMVTDSWTIARHYLLSLGFCLDVASVLPLEVFSLAWVATPHFWGYMALFRTNRLIKLWKVVSFFAGLEGSLYISIAQSTAIKFSIYILTATHLGACLWYPVACFTGESCVSSSWAAAHSISSNTTGFHDYLISLYWSSATMTTVGYGDISAHNIQEMVLSLIIQLFGVMLYGYCLGAIAATLTNVASPRVSFQEKMQVVHQFMFDHNLGKGLLERVDHYFTLLWDQYRGEAVPGGLRLMHDMPRNIQQDVSMEETATLLSNAPFFQHVDASFLRSLSLVTSTYLFSPADIVLYSGDMGREMYFIRKGYVEILTEDMFHVVSVLQPGSYFGELGFLFGAPRSAAVRAATHLELVMLNRLDMDAILESFPLISKQFQDLSADTEHLASAQEAAREASARVMNSPKLFPKPCITSALAVAMATPLSVGVRAPLANTIAACVGGKDIQRKVSCPVSIGQPVSGSVVRFSRKELQELMRRRDQEAVTGVARQPTGLRRRRPLSAVSVTRPQEAWVEGEGGEGVTRVPVEEGGSCCRALASGVEKVFSYCLIPFTLVPTSLLGQVWEVVATLLALAAAITVSLQAAFLHHDAPLWTINYCIDLFFFADVVLKLHTAFYNKDGVLITQPIACAKHYFKTNFLMDFLSSFPTDFVVLVSWPRDISDVLRVLSLARLNRVLRLYKLPLAFDYLEGQIARSTGLIKEVKFAVYMTVCTHLTACGWFLLACASLSITGSQSHTCKVGSWALQFSDVPLSDYSSAYKYVVSLYWATATTTTVGYGDIRAYTDLERLYSTFVMVLGVVAYGYIIASVAASLANADSGRAQYQDKLKAVKSYLQDQSMDSAITKRVVNYYEYIWQRNKGVSFVSLFQGMPISLQADISLSLYKKIIDQVPLFQNTEIGFTKLLALAIRPVLFLSKEYVVRKGDIGSEMFFINRGTVEVVSEDGTVVFASMNEGKFFGEISLVFSCPRTASIRAATNCDLFVLTKSDLDRALVYYPDIAEQIRIVAGTRANLVKKRSQIAAKAAAEGKSAADAAMAAAQGTKDEDTEQGKKESPTPPSSSSSSSPSSSSPPPPPPPPTESSSSSSSSSKGAEGAEGQKESTQDVKKEAEVKPVTAPEAATATAPSQGSPTPSITEPRPPSYLQACCAQRVWPRLRRLLTFTIARDGKVGTGLHLAGCLLAYLSAFTISYQACFQNNAPSLWGINYVFEAFFLVEIFLKFHLTYEDEQGRTEDNFKSIARHYLKAPSGFFLDVVTIFPFEMLALPVPSPSARRAALLYLRLPHVMRVVRIQWFFSTEEKRLNQKTVLLRILKFIVLISLCTHFVACLWYVMGCQASTCRDRSWATTANFVGTAMSDADHYCNSLYWAVATMTTTGYGDLSATNVQEMLYAIAVMVVGKLLFGFILGSIASTLANLETQRVLFEEKINALKDYMKEQHLSTVMRARVLDFFGYLWVRNKGTDRQRLFADMPYCMQAEVSLATTEALLKRVPIFESADWAFLRHLTLVIKPCLFLPGEIIVHRGDVGLGMFFLYHGSVEVIDHEEPGAVKEVLTEGSYFGDKSLLYNTPMESTVRAITHVDMFTFSQTDYEKVLLDHPTIEGMVRDVGEREFGAPVPAVHT